MKKIYGLLKSFTKKQGPFNVPVKMKKIINFFKIVFFSNLFLFCPLFCFLSAQPCKNVFENESEQNDLKGLPLFDSQYTLRQPPAPRITKKQQIKIDAERNFTQAFQKRDFNKMETFIKTFPFLKSLRISVMSRLAKEIV